MPYNTSIESLCAGCPPEFVTMLDYCRGRLYTDRPDYTYLRRLLKDVATREQIQFDFEFDWTELLNCKAKQALGNQDGGGSAASGTEPPREDKDGERHAQGKREVTTR